MISQVESLSEAQEVGDSLGRIVGGIADTTQGMQDIQLSTSKQTATASEVTKSVNGISAIVEKILQVLKKWRQVPRSSQLKLNFAWFSWSFHIAVR